MTDKKADKPDEPTVQYFDGEEENIAAIDWDELEQRDRCDHIDKLQWGSETLALHEARDIMNEFKKRVHQTMRALVFGPMFRQPLRFLSLWKILFLVEPDTFIDIAESDPISSATKERR